MAGAVVIITHDQEFCQAVKPTHIARVAPDGSVSVGLCINGELKPEDFDPKATIQVRESPSGSKGAGKGGDGGNGKVVMGSKEGKKLMQQMQNKLKKLEASIEKGEAAIRGFDEELMQAGSDAEAAVKVMKAKEEVASTLRGFEEEWEQVGREEEELRMAIGN